MGAPRPAHNHLPLRISHFPPFTPLCFVDRAMKSILECSGESRLTSSPPRVTQSSRPRFKIPPSCTRIIATILSPVRSAHVRSLGPKRSLVSSLFDQHPVPSSRTLHPRCSPLTLDRPHTPCYRRSSPSRSFSWPLSSYPHSSLAPLRHIRLWRSSVPRTVTLLFSADTSSTKGQSLTSLLVFVC